MPSSQRQLASLVDITPRLLPTSDTGMAAVPTAASSALDGHQRLADELRVKIEGYGDGNGGPSGSASAEHGMDGGSGRLRPYATVKERLTHLVHSYKYQVRREGARTGRHGAADSIVGCNCNLVDWHVKRQ